ncbi:hypothetical protein JO972_14510 [Verrucomicrobiaceae bacterium 5K15]|uniref:Uncharacterized protein n=1 Tax=Oceaniferula flava TaxID=2800421 RepID=A0AAE2SGJ8_9BACT|nr:hypothetical protein [Oceaniferula flavus]MBK1856180.1 hypothetical protein [Oceaniferula flavus]MBM1137487.1 hypothetical protein [Oceaniferula flavus]
MAKSASNPFDHAFEMLGDAPEVATDCVNSEALETLTQALTTRATSRGRMILLRSPRAGFGKTHLLKRLHERVAHTHEFIPLEPSKGKNLSATECLDAVLRRFSRILPSGGGLTVLDLLARRILATGLEPLVRSGEVPSQDRDSALQALQERPVETFDFHNEDAVTARWAQANFNLLGPRLTAELAERTDSGFRPVAWWVELLFHYSSAELEQTTRNSSLFETVFGNGAAETDMHEKLVSLMNLTGLVTSPVLVLDEVEGFSSDPDAALQVASFLNALHQSCDQLALIISVNGDVWETAFLPRLPCGLKDRLSDIVVDLRPMTKEQAASLIKDRAGEHADQILDTMDLDTGVIYARGLIREASNKWEELGLVKAEPEEVEEVEEVEPIEEKVDSEMEVPEPESSEPTAPVTAPVSTPAAAPVVNTGPISLASEPEAPDPFGMSQENQTEPSAPYTVASIAAAAPVAAASTSDAIAAAAAAAAELEEDEIPSAYQPETQRVSEAVSSVEPSPFEQVDPAVTAHDFSQAQEQPQIIASKPTQAVVSPFDTTVAQEPVVDFSEQQGTHEQNNYQDSATQQVNQPFGQPQAAAQPFAQAQEQTPAAFSPPTQTVQNDTSGYSESRPFADHTQAGESQPQQVSQPQSQHPSPFSFAEEPVQASAPFEPAQPESAVEASIFAPAEPVQNQAQSNESSIAQDSPFSIDTEATPVSPFQAVQPAVSQPVSPAQPASAVSQPLQQAAPQNSPFEVSQESSAAPAPHSVTSDDQEKVEDLLRQFRDRYGRNDS